MTRNRLRATSLLVITLRCLSGGWVHACIIRTGDDVCLFLRLSRRHFVTSIQSNWEIIVLLRWWRRRWLGLFVFIFIPTVNLENVEVSKFRHFLEISRSSKTYWNIGIERFFHSKDKVDFYLNVRIKKFFKNIFVNIVDNPSSSHRKMQWINYGKWQLSDLENWRTWATACSLLVHIWLSRRRLDWIALL